jgi:hypothetical protein
MTLFAISEKVGTGSDAFMAAARARIGSIF